MHIFCYLLFFFYEFQKCTAQNSCRQNFGNHPLFRCFTVGILNTTYYEY